MFITVTRCTTTSKERACTIICLCQQTWRKRGFANVNMTSYCDVSNSGSSSHNDRHTPLLNTRIW